MNWLVEKASAADFSFNFISLSDSNASLGEFVNRIIDIMLFLAAAAAIIYLIYSGILYITAAGNPDAAKKGQQGIINAVIGIVIIVLAYFIANAVASFASGTADNTVMAIRSLIG